MYKGLKPCPFCGGRGKIMRHGNGAYKVQCEKCGARTAKVVIQPWHSTKFVTQGKAAKEWNQRVEDNVPADLN